MKISRFSALACLALCLLLPSCGQRESSDARVSAIRLFDIFESDDLVDGVDLGNAGWEPTEWKAADMRPWQMGEEPPTLGFRTVNDLGDLKVAGSALTATIDGDTPILQFALKQNRGGAGPVRFIDVRMRVAGAGEVWLKPEGAKEVEDSAIIKWAGSKEWKGSLDVANNALQTYRFELSDGDNGSRRGRGPGGPPPPGGPDGPPPGGGGPPPPGGPGGPRPPGNGPGQGNSPRDLRHFFLTFHDCGNAEVAIESVRFVTEKEVKLDETSGQQWSGLADIFRETLAAKSSETLRFPLRQLPDRPWLDLAIGTPEDSPVTFKVTVTGRDKSEAADPGVLLERTVTIPDRWQTVRIDLAEFAGKSVMMELALEGGKKGLWGYWGAPVIRSSFADTSPSAARASAAKKPCGVIFLVVDTLRPDHLNIFGYERETVVHLKQFADEGVAFSNAIAQSTWTKVSQPSMVTSMYPMATTVLGMDHGLPASAETIAEIYREAGYATVCYSSVMFTGKGNNMHQGYEELHESSSVSDQDYNSKTARHYVDRFIPWLERHRDVPFFAYLHVFDPHSPFRPRPPYDTIWAGSGDKERVAEIDEEVKRLEVKTSHGLPFKTDYIEKTGNDPDELLRIYTDWYDGSIRGMDAEIGRLLQAMHEMGIEDDTLIVFASDHGEELWEHGQFFHGQSVYGELSQVPLVFRWPNNPAIRKGTMVDNVVENVDIMPTLLELSGIEGPSVMQGRSLVPLLDGSGEASWKERLAVTQVLAGDGPDGNKPHFGIIENGWKVVRKEVDPDVKEELYDRSADPFDLNDLIDSADNKERVGTITESFEEWRTRMEGAELPGDDEIAGDLSSEELRRLQALGYVGGGVKAKSDDDSKKEVGDDAK